MEQWEIDLVKQLEEMDEAEARSRFNRGDFGLIGGLKWSAVKKWLESKETERQTSREIKVLEISEEANSIERAALSNSRDALSKSLRSNKIAIIAMILSAAATIIAAIIGLYK
jgi:hypothetical protein